MQLMSDAFADGARIPEKHTCDGPGTSPPLKWSGAPRDAESFVVLCEDPDAPSGTFKHWAIFDIATSTSSLPANVPSKTGDFKQAKNDFGEVGYGAPCPPKGHGAHHYHFEVWALDTPNLGVERDATYAEVKKAAVDHKLASARLTGIYER